MAGIAGGEPVALAYLNGRWHSGAAAILPVDDQALLYGLGLFETIRVVEGRPAFLERHLNRLYSSAPVLGIALPWSREGLTDLIGGALAGCGAAGGEGALRLTVTAGAARGVSGPGFVLYWRPGYPYPEELYERGMAAVTAAGRRNPHSLLCRIKSLNYAESFLARREAANRGADEAIFLNTAGELAEGTATNLFLVVGGRLFTPSPACGILPGVARSVVLELAREELGLQCEEGHYEPETLRTADEVFLTNALMGVMPLVSLDGRPVGGGQPGPVTRRLRMALNRRAVVS